jgi:hypothetical protein
VQETDLNGALAAFESSIAAQGDAIGEDVTHAGTLALYRELAVAVRRVASSDRRSVSAEDRR